MVIIAQTDRISRPHVVFYIILRKSLCKRNIRRARATKKWLISSPGIYDKKVNIGLTVVDSGIRTVTILLIENLFSAVYVTITILFR